MRAAEGLAVERLEAIDAAAEKGLNASVWHRSIISAAPLSPQEFAPGVATALAPPGELVHRR